MTRNERDFTKVPNDVLRTHALTMPQKVVYELLLSRCWGKEWCLTSQKRLAQEAPCSERSVIAHLQALEEKGYIRTERRGERRVNRYWILSRLK
jgi:DNA-binding MarR family transcriptional regulator